MADTRLEEIRNLRLNRRHALIEASMPPYPSEVRRTHTAKTFLEAFETLSSDTTPVVLLGRVSAIRTHGSLCFIDLTDASGTIQLYLNKEEMSEGVFERTAHVDSGDWIEASGLANTTSRGTHSLFVSTLRIVSKSIRPLPDKHYGLKDPETRYRQREVDLALNPDVLSVFKTRSKVVNALRNLLHEEGFLEVETPTLQPIAGGAAAEPFTTHHNALDMDLYLRIAPELYLKRLLVGGIEKVFEIGKNFRNEGISRQHNPEFTMLEFYWAYADYEDLMEFTEKLFSTLVPDGELPWQGELLSLKTPFRKERFVDLVSKKTGFDILEEKNPEAYIEVFKKHNLDIPETRTYTKLVDELYKELIRPTLIQPTILYDYPTEMAPLAKQNLTDPRVAEMFQLLIAGAEVVKAYTELNDPVIQRQKFEEQQAARDAGDAEAQSIDEDYVRAMEYGMPPCAGYGLGIDRLTMILTDTPHLRDTILFPLLKPKQ